MTLNEERLYSMLGEKERCREAYNAAAYDQDGDLVLGGHGNELYNNAEEENYIMKKG